MLKYVDAKEGYVNFEKINQRIRVFAYYDLYPDMEFLKGLMESREKDDIKVSALKQLNV